MRPTLTPALFLALALVAGCGGGGGSSGLTLSRQSLDISAQQGMAAPTGSIDLTLTDPKAAYVGAAYAAGQAQPAWIGLSISHVDATHFRLDVSILNTSMPIGTYATTFLVGTADANGNVLESHAVTVTLRVQTRPPFLDGSTPASFAFTEGDGQSMEPQYFALNVGGTNPRTCDAIVSVQDDGGWLQASPATVTLGTTTTVFTVTARPGYPAGSHAGQVTVSCVIDGVVLSTQIPAALAVDEHRLMPSAVGVALLSTPTRLSLARLVRIGDSLGRAAVPWTAASDQPWLTVTPSGTAPGTLQLTADPSGLGAGTHLAWVTLSSSDATVMPTERIRVGLTVLGADPGPAFLAGYFGALVTSPVEPVVFAVAGNTDVVGYDLNTGAVVRTFSHVATTASRLAVSGDGTLLYVWDSGAFQVAEVDAATGAVTRTFASGAKGIWYPDPQSGLAWVHPAGRPELLTPWSYVYDLTTGYQIAEPFVQAVQGGGLVATGDGAGVVTGSATLYALHRTSIPWDRSWAVKSAGPEFAPTYTMTCPSGDGGHLYQVAGPAIRDWDVAAGAFGADYPTPEAVTLRTAVCGWSGLLVVGGQSLPNGHDLWVFAPPGRTPVSSLYSTGAASTNYGGLYGLAVSADQSRVVAFSAPQFGAAAGLYFHTLPPRP